MILNKAYLSLKKRSFKLLSLKYYKMRFRLLQLKCRLTGSLKINFLLLLIAKIQRLVPF